jgi:hypothetical protein
MMLVRAPLHDRTRLGGSLALGLGSLAVALALAAPLDAQEADKAGGAPATRAEEPAAAPVIRWTEAPEHIGEEVTIEGEIVATHASPLSTLLSFDQGFNRFTAVIQPAARAAFPPSPEEFYKGKLVRIRGRVIEYEKKPEIILASPGQITVLTGETPAAAADEQEEEDDATLVTLELLRRLTAIESSLQDLADRLDLILTALEQQAPKPEAPTAYLLPGRVPESEAPERPAYQHLRSLKRGMTARQVQEMLGDPAFVDPNSEGGEIWYYGSGRTISFNRRGRVEAMAGFQQRR